MQRDGDDGIGCDWWFHVVGMFMGLPDKAIKEIIDLEGKGYFMFVYHVQ